MKFKVGDVVRYNEAAVDAWLFPHIQIPAYGVVVGQSYQLGDPPLSKDHVVPVQWYNDRGMEAELPLPFNSRVEWEYFLALSPLSIVENLHEVQSR